VAWWSSALALGCWKGRRLADVDANGVKTGVTGSIGEDFETDRLTRRFVFNQNQSIIQFSTDLIFARGLPKNG